jgi:hypothetical protein
LLPIQNLAAKSKRKRQFGGRRDDNIKIDLNEIGSEDVDWIHLVQNTIQ